MHLTLNKIYEILHEAEEHNFESEANCLYYIVSFYEDQVSIYEVEEYHYDGDNWGEIDVTSNKHKITSIPVTIEEYLKIILQYVKIISEFNGKEILKYEFPYVGHQVYFMEGEIN